ncbi:GNAT family N-acetyltransferase [Salipiger pacificus]|uniref:GNAT family N-acetyltransferase n=2 Tax=Salipiger mangrovisoli TaxID=2865933 RepID=A0ABR9WXN0_9RHOB|nr:GNAT family N-acetyltransferase [Salipiger mangrovisoli]
MRPSLEAIQRFDPIRVRRRFLDGFAPEDTTLLLCDDRLAGFYVLRRRPHEHYLDHFYLGAGFRGTGLGRKIIAGLQQGAREARMPIRLMALKGSPANDFYRTCGFELVGEEPLDLVYRWQP